MQCTYAVTLSTKRWTNETKGRCVEAVTEWLAKNFPTDRLPANIRVRVRPLGEDDVYRAEVLNTQQSGVNSILITVSALSGQLVFDLRNRFIPASTAVVPGRKPALPPKPVLALVVRMSELLEVYDAERRVDGRIRRVASELDGQALAADFRDAPARRLPIITEFVVGNDANSTVTGGFAAELVGVAVVAHLESEQAVQAFNDYCGSPVISTNYISVLWPRGEQPLTLHTSRPSKEQIVGPILEAAANQPEPMTPLLGRSTPRPTEPARRTDSTPPTTAELERVQHLLDEQRMHIDAQDELIETIETEREELEEELDERDQTIALQQERLDELILNKTELEAYLARVAPSASMPRVLDAVYRAAKECKNLEFARTAYDTANDLEGPVPFTVFSILRSLDQAMAEWRADRIPAAGLRSYLRQLRIDYVPDISDNAKQKYIDDYTITHDGKKFLLGPHVRSGRRRNLLRIYLHVDETAKTMLVGKVTRHLEDSTS